MRRMILLFFALCLAGCSEEKIDVHIVTVDEIHARLGSRVSPLIVDVRSPEEFRQGHIPGAINIPYEQISDRVGELDSDTGVALYCAVGPRARRGEVALVERGYQAPIYHIDGGINAWLEKQLPLEQP